MVTLSLYGSLLLNVVVGGLLPMLVAAVTKANASTGLKAVVHGVLAMLYGIGQAWVAADAAHQAFDFKGALATALAAWIIGAVAHMAAWKPLKLTGPDGVIDKITSAFGIG